jgi:hypothetical protein
MLTAQQPPRSLVTIGYIAGQVDRYLMLAIWHFTAQVCNQISVRVASCALEM